MGWPIDADALFAQLVHFRDHYDNVPIYVTENGAGFEESPGADDWIADDNRVAYLREHLNACRRAIAHGCNLKGYFIWTLLDNFEWADGYSKRFGLVAVDRNSLARNDLVKGLGGWRRVQAAA